MPSSRCQGDITVAAKVDKPMQEFIDAEAERCGVTRTELMRRVLDGFRDASAGQLECVECGTKLTLNPCPKKD
jgi:hypothetical protein